MSSSLASFRLSNIEDITNKPLHSDLYPLPYCLALIELSLNCCVLYAGPLGLVARGHLKIPRVFTLLTL